MNYQNRRGFIRQSLAAAAFTIVPRHVLGKGWLAPSDVIQMGFIGTGKQSETLLKNFLKTGQVRIVAISEIHKLKANRFIGWHQKYYTDNLPDQTANELNVYPDYLELLSRKDIDAVAIITPDHWHGPMAIQAANHGKDIYCEKPLSLTIREGRAMINAVRKNKRVFQTGSMQRSWPNFRKACELVRNGYIGEIREVQVNVGNPPIPIDFSGEPIPEYIDWNAWLGPNDPSIYHHYLAPGLEDTYWAKWRDYKPFGGGQVTDYGAHMFDIALWGLGLDGVGPEKLIPPQNIPTTGDIRGIELQFRHHAPIRHFDFGQKNAVRFIGKEGTIDISRSNFTTPDTLKDLQLKSSDVHLPITESHYQDFIHCMRTRSKPICDIEIGHSTATVCNLINIAYQLKRSLVWNSKKEIFRHDDEANTLLTRKHWEQFAG